ncbi:UvrD-helicase domain-containing protein [uncultured Aeromicrobium sp.]|uniref:UvrD-helicase domain-containing protein n=2 Tax=Aeromicrobium TaxID=2040 RepID=UPI000A8A9C98|nr:UvrD-helicase domain-containing protein [uncultured Aeromicrobium sp.]
MSADAPVVEFDIADPLPTGTTLLEASAGTGKTWAIAALVTRLVAEGVATLDQLLVVTFGRAASAELKDRVRERLVQADAVLAAGHGDERDPLQRLLLDVDDTERTARRRRLRAAVARFDEATITTTHGFCQAVLRSLGTTGDVEPGSVLVEDDTDIVDQVVSDLYLRAVGRGQTPPFDHQEAAVLGRRAVEDPSAHLLPTDAEPGSAPDLRRRFASAVRDESARRRLAARTLSYDDLLQRLAEALEPDDSPARTVMRDRWRVVLVDEFQDTDPVQWRILERAFVGHATMVLVGDPKQAIYGFRGGDVDTYLRAAAQADTRRTLTVNHRSDAPLVSAVDAVLRGAALGDPAIVVRPASASLDGSRLHDPRGDAPFRLRAHLRSDAGSDDDALRIGDVRPRVARDVAADVAALLGSGATYDHGAGPVPLTAGDVAVLVERHGDAELLHAELERRGVPAVRTGGADVLQSRAGQDWVTLLTAMEAPHRSGYTRAAALGPFLGLTATELAADDGDALTDRVSSRLRDLTDLQRERGTAGMVEALTADASVVERLLRHQGGRRRLTDLEHVGQVLAIAAREHGLGLSGLRRWLLDRRSETSPAADRTHRLDTDADAVQIVTTFVSKGLQYPVVYVPFLFDRWVPEPSIVRLHDDDGRRCLDVGGAGPSWTTHARRSDVERAGESLRLLYVALTRAQSRLVVHWSPTFNARHGALHRLLFRPDPTRPEVPDVQAVPSDHDAVARLRAWQERGGPVVEQMVTGDAELAPAAGEAERLEVRHLRRDVDTVWTRTSYTSLVRRDEGPSVSSEPEPTAADDEVDVVADVAASPVLGPSPWAELAGGAALGTLVHGVLEHVDVGADDLDAEVRRRVEEELASRPLAVDVDVLAPALVGALSTPLGPLADDLTLAEALGRRPFREMEFELPLAGGDSVRAAGRTGTLADVADLMEAHLPSGDPLRPFAAELRDASLRGRTLRGYLTGSIDLLLRLDGDRTLVVDHKTNRLESGALVEAGGGLEAYAPERLADAMLHTTYPLQALLYAVAQHRFLRWRLRGYDPDVHLAGVLYLFVRGMTGPDGPRGADGSPFGVFAWRPPSALVLDLSALLDGSPTDGGPR